MVQKIGKIILITDKWLVFNFPVLDVIKPVLDGK